MQQLTRYYRRSRISEREMRQIIKYFALDSTVGKTGELVAVTRQGRCPRIFVKICHRIPEECERASCVRRHGRALMKVISEQNEFAESAGAARPEKRLCLEFSNVMARSIPRLCQTGICADFRVEEKWIQGEILDIPLRIFAPVRMKYYAG